MDKWYISIIFLFTINFELHSQKYWEIYGGINHSNIIHKINGQSILYIHTKNAPLWNYGFQFGIDNIRIINSSLLWSYGLRLQLKGDYKSFHEIAPQNEFHSLRFIDLMLPLNIKYKILTSKEIFLKLGVSGNYVIYQNKDDYLAIFPLGSFNSKLGLSGQFGFKFLISNRISTELMYSQGLTNIYKLPIPQGTFYPPGSAFTYRHQAFEFSTFYKL